MMSDITVVREFNIINGYIFNPDAQELILVDDVLLTIPGMEPKQLTTRAGQKFLETSMIGGQIECCKNVPADAIVNQLVEEFVPTPPDINCPCPDFDGKGILMVLVTFTGSDISQCGCIIPFYANTRVIAGLAADDGCKWEQTIFDGNYQISVEWNPTLCAWILRIYCAINQAMVEIWEGINYTNTPFGTYSSFGSYCGTGLTGLVSPYYPD
jgi:hypothetical protein